MIGLLQSKYARKLLTVFLITLVIDIFIIGFSLLPREVDPAGIGRWINGMEEASVVWRFSSRTIASQTFAISTEKGGVLGIQEKIGVFKRIRLVPGDSASIDYFGSYPFDNQVWANIIQHYSELPEAEKPAAIYFEPIISQPGPKPESDLALEKSIAGFKGSIGGNFLLEPFGRQPILIHDKSQLKRLLRGKPINRVLMDYRSETAQSLKRWEIPLPEGLQDKVYQYARPITPLPSLSEKLGYFGTANIEGDNEIQQRKLPLFSGCWYYSQDESGSVSVTNVFYPSSVLSLIAVLTSSHLSNLSFDQNGFLVLRHCTYESELFTVKDGDIRIPVDASYRMDINYRSAPTSDYFNMTPLKEILNASFKPGSILIFGMKTPGSALKQYQSPVGEAYGSDQIAFALGTILNQDFLTETPAWINILYILALTLLVAFLVTKGTRFTVIGGLLAIVIPLATGFLLFQANIQIVTIIALFASLLTLIFAEVYMIITEQSEKRFIQSTFSSYVNPDLVNILIQNPEMMALGGDEKTVTMLFSDIRGFTTISEGMQPMELVNFVNEYLTKMTDIVLETGGTLDKYIGDAVVAFWGAPIPMEDHAFRACEASVRMMEALDLFNQEQTRKGFQPIRIGIGLNTGPATVGNIGSEKKKNFTAIGEHATLAEDLQDGNKIYRTSVIISETTWELVKDRVITRELDLIRSEAHDRLIRIFELLDVKR